MNSRAGGGGQSQALVQDASGRIFSAFPLEPVPSFQKGLGLTGRGTPDVSWDGDPVTGFAVYDSFAFGTATPWDVIGGTSAGAAIQADLMVRGSPLGNKAIFDRGYARGFGFLPGTSIDIHVAERGRLDAFIKRIADHPQYLGLALDEETGAEVRGSQLNVLGKGSLWIVNPDVPAATLQLHASDSYDLISRKRN